MTLNLLFQRFHDLLDPIYDKDEVSAFFYILIEHELKLSRLEYALDPQQLIDGEREVIFENAITALEQEMPIQYVTGRAIFYELKFKVTPETLIPRPETEELVSWVISRVSELSKKDTLNILDVGTGSGCIAIVLARELKHAKVTAIDVSNEALSVAKVNALQHEVDIEFIHANILLAEEISVQLLDRKFDIIVSNPPYVKHEERKNMRRNVLEYEPELALFVENDDPLKFYKAIAARSKQLLKDNGILFLEINEALGSEMIDLMEDQAFKNVKLRKDLFGKDRMILAEK